MKVDILVIGLGPAGASVLKHLVSKTEGKFSILGVDKRSRPGFPVQCGEFMPSPEEMETLIPDVPNAREFFSFESKYISTRTSKISFFSPQGKIIRTPFEGYSIHRGNWNEDLINFAEKEGAEIWRAATAKKLENGTVWISREDSSLESVIPRVIIGADGVKSHVARWTGLAEKRTPEHFVYVKQHVFTNISSSDYDPTDVQMFFGEDYAPGAYAWIIPKDNKTANVGVGIRFPMAKGKITVSKALENLVELHPQASQILSGGRITSTIGGLVPVGLPLKRTFDNSSKTLLLGDAASQIVSSVGGGIPPSMVAGAVAADIINKHFSSDLPLQNYEHVWKKQMDKMFYRAYKLRRLFDKISTGSDDRVQWYLNRLKSSDVNKVVHCRVPLKVTLSFPLIQYFNYLLDKVV
jgi:geranylgeranyl reductase family protein